MKKLSLFAIALFTLTSTIAQTASVQIIHNSPDDAAQSVDIFLNGTITDVQGLNFREATPFLELPAGTQTVGVAPAGGSPIADFDLDLVDGMTYIVVANGITGLSSTVYNDAQPFGLNVFGMGQTSAMAEMTNVLVHHGSMDAPAVDVVEVGVGAGTIVDGAAYPGFITDYLALGTADYALAVQTDDNSATVATFAAPLASLGLEGQAITVVASGFLDPSNNGDGPAFGLFAALTAGGALVPLPLAVENDNPCDAEMLATDGTPTIGNNTFATVGATEGVIAPPQTGCQTQDGWCGFESGIDGSVWYSFEAISSEGNITTCLDDNTIDTQIALYSASDCTDFSTLSLIAANDDQSGGCTNGGSGFASNLDFSGLIPGNTYWILVDGYNGESGPFAISVTQVQSSSARAQIIHNSAEDVAAVVDIYVNEALALPGVEFRTASGFLDLPAGDVTIDIAPGGSADVSESIYNVTVNLESGATYIIIADGITGLSTGTYNPSPAFGLQVYDMGREAATSASNTDVLVHHGSTDAPTVDVVEVGVGAGIIVDNASYTDFAGYLELGTLDYQLAIQDENNTTTVATYEAPLSTLGLDGAAITVVASGFLNTVENNDGPAFGLWVATATGGDLIPLPLVTSLDEVEPIDFNMFPNPANDELFINSVEQIESIAIYDTQGRLVFSEANNIQRIDISELPEGFYAVAVSVGDRVSTERLVKL